MNPRGFFATGTDTGVGKTLVSVALLHALRAAGEYAVGMKPVASGCIETPAGWQNADALALQLASDGMPAYALVNPFALPAATAPQIAAQQAGIVVSLPPMLAAYRELSAQASAMVVEGVGGWLAPLADGLDQAELVRALDLEVVLVVGLRLGCINHARLSERAILGQGCRLLGWVGNAIEAGFDSQGDYSRTLTQSLAAPCMGMLEHQAQATPHDHASKLSAALRRAGLPAG